MSATAAVAEEAVQTLHGVEHRGGDEEVCARGGAVADEEGDAGVGSNLCGTAWRCAMEAHGALRRPPRGSAHEQGSLPV